MWPFSQFPWIPTSQQSEAIPLVYGTLWQKPPGSEVKSCTNSMLILAVMLTK